MVLLGKGEGLKCYSPGTWVLEQLGGVLKQYYVRKVRSLNLRCPGKCRVSQHDANYS